MAGNVVEIEVTAVNSTKAGFDEAKAEADGAAESLNEYSESAERAAKANADLALAMADYKAAAAEAKEATATLAEAEADSGKESTDYALALDEAAGAQQRLTDSSARLKTAQAEAAAAQDDSTRKTDEGALAASGAGSKLKDLALGAGAVAVGALYMGMKFQEASTQLVTGAGQSEAGLKMVEQGMLAVSTQTATSSKDIEAGMYMIESAGFHGAQGLDVLKAAAEGAKVGNAQLGDVANVVTSALNAYHEPASRAVSVTDQLVATVASGKMHMQDLTTAMASVLPVAASYGVSLSQVGGALATMTMQGMTARRSSTDLAFLLRGLAAPGATAQKAMQGVGLSAQQLSSDLSTKGLAGTLQIVEAAIAKNTHSSYAAREAMLAITGGATGLTTALMLTGKHESTFTDNTKAVGDAARHAGKDVQGWGDVTKDTAFKLDQAKTAVENTGTAVGMALLPAVTKILGPLAEFASWISKSKLAVDILAGAIGGILAGYAVVKAVSAFKALGSALSAIGGVVTTLAEKLGIMTGATEAQAAATGEAEIAQDGLNLAMLANPITLIIAAIALLVIAFVELWKHCKTFRDFWKDMWHDVVAFAKAAWDVIKAGLSDLEDMFKSDWDAISSAVREAWNVIKMIVTDAVQVVRDIIAAAMALVEGHWSAAWHDLLNAASAGMHMIESVIESVGGRFGQLLVDAGRDLIEGLIHGIESAVGGLMSTVSGLAGDISSAFKSVLGLLSPSKVFRKHGEDIVAGLVQGIEGASPGALAASRRLLAGAAGAIGTGGYGGGMAGALQIVVQPGGTGLDQLFINWLKQSIRARGGSGPNSVQRALGQVS